MQRERESLQEGRESMGHGRELPLPPASPSSHSLYLELGFTIALGRVFEGVGVGVELATAWDQRTVCLASGRGTVHHLQ